ncbi:MAG: ACT domain-containing protein [Solobacterium sp.]|jgi:chorismate mutase|nr:ACT domain-containing protein [Solobacterium sp.]MBQ1320522.1 ACT domain-containing protein [Solobacterium sp.]MBQ1355985.1 ACT domain-containing protein [Solobacterium sp.]
MAEKYLIVNKKILPDYLDKVIEARHLLMSCEVLTITEAVQRVGISRNTYYKYKDYVFQPEETDNQRRASLSMVLAHEAGALSAVLGSISRANASIITISQSTPVALRASVMMVLDITNLHGTIDTLIEVLKDLSQVHSVHLDALE